MLVKHKTVLKLTASSNITQENVRYGCQVCPFPFRCFTAKNVSVCAANCSTLDEERRLFDEQTDVCFVILDIITYHHHLQT